MWSAPKLVLLLGLFAAGMAAYFAIDRALFLQRAEATNGTTMSVSSHNGRCGGGRRRRSHPCTKFKAAISFRTSSGVQSELKLDAGSAPYHDQPTSRARYRVGQAVPVLYDPKNPGKAFHNSFLGIWGTPLWVGLGSLSLFVGALQQGRRRL